MHSPLIETQRQQQTDQTEAVRKPRGLNEDLVGLFGIGLIGYGAYLIYPPYAFISVGILLLILALLASRG